MLYIDIEFGEQYITINLIWTYIWNVNNFIFVTRPLNRMMEKFDFTKQNQNIVITKHWHFKQTYPSETEKFVWEKIQSINNWFASNSNAFYLYWFFTTFTYTLKSKNCKKSKILHQYKEITLNNITKSIALWYNFFVSKKSRFTFLNGWKTTDWKWTTAGGLSWKIMNRWLWGDRNIFTLATKPRHMLENKYYFTSTQ